ncbi:MULTISPECIES: type I pantothenate kinase [Sphingobacterium]|uniref:Pantothenate kinase n=1 Tax=Sphingobacterium hotanense TaxID=649196 RepID=A0ABT7NL65_9SPHI|nr:MULTISPECIES: type I pantothenate kinase [Sphingobacterium]MDM1047962.1 type I pantothenate kinase [Sphingobacterium hotanense]
MPFISEHTFTSPFQNFTREEWKRLNGQLSNMLAEEDLGALHALNEPLTMEEIEDIYIPLAHLLDVHITGFRELHRQSNDFFRRNNSKLPFIIGIAGSVAVGKSTTARVLRKVLSLLPNKPKVELVTTDGFLYPNKELIRRDILNRKGFPESYNTKELLQFLSDVKSGKSSLTVPIYSHLEYDVLPQDKITIAQPDILIVEGINVLQVNSRKNGVFVSDFFDYSIYVDADEKNIVAWYIDRFESLRATAFQNEKSYFHKYANMSVEESVEMATQIWNEINRPNLHENILPTRYRADLILKKGSHHFVKRVKVRKI